MVCLAIICSSSTNYKRKIDLKFEEPCGRLYIAIQKASSILCVNYTFSDRTWMEFASAILELSPRIPAMEPLIQQRDALNAVWAFVYICSKRFALSSLDSIEDCVKRYKRSCISLTSN
jgi:hypothetical protein